MNNFGEMGVTPLTTDEMRNIEGGIAPLIIGGIIVCVLGTLLSLTVNYLVFEVILKKKESASNVCPC